MDLSTHLGAQHTKITNCSLSFELCLTWTKIRLKNWLRQTLLNGIKTTICSRAQHPVASAAARVEWGSVQISVMPSWFALKSAQLRHHFYSLCAASCFSQQHPSIFWCWSLPPSYASCPLSPSWAPALSGLLRMQQPQLLSTHRRWAGSETLPTRENNFLPCSYKQLNSSDHWRQNAFFPCVRGRAAMLAQSNPHSQIR